MNKKIIFLIIRIVVGVIFIVSGFIKLMEPYQNLLAVIYSYKIISGPLATLFAMTMPWAELIFGTFLLAGLCIRWSALALWGMNSTFVGAISLALLRKLEINDCGCFGGSHLSMPLRNILILDITLWFIFMILVVFPKSVSFVSLDAFLSLDTQKRVC